MSELVWTRVRFPYGPLEVVGLPLDDEARRRGQQKSLEVRRRKALERQLKSEVVRRVVDETRDLAPAALETVLELVVQVRDGLDKLPVNNTLDAHRLANTAEVLYKIARLASGQSTANVAHAKSLSDEERAERIAYLRSRLSTMELSEGEPDAV